MRRSVMFPCMLLAFSLLSVTRVAAQRPTGGHQLPPPQGQAVADNRPAPDAGAADALGHGLRNSGSRNPLQVIFSGGVTGILIILLLVAISMIAMALAVEHLLTIRRSVLIPDRLGRQVHGHLPGQSQRPCAVWPTGGRMCAGHLQVRLVAPPYGLTAKAASLTLGWCR